MTISNIVSPVMSYADRFIVGAVISSAAVAYYVTPQELITKLSILPGALTAVLFPALAAQIARQDKAVMPLINKAVGWIFLTLLPITVAIAIFAKELLTLWVGESFASQSYVLLQIFSAGMFITCIAQIPFTVIQGAGKSHLTAIFHLIEVPLFLGALLLLSRNYGLTGAAIAWFLRVAVDAVLMFWGVKLVLNRSMFTSAKLRLLSVSGLAVVGFVGALVPSPSVRAAWLVAIVALVLLIAVRGSARFGRGSRA